MICELHGENPSPGVRNHCMICQRADFAEADAILSRRFRVGRFGRWLNRHKPGDTLAAFIKWLGYTPSSSCGCATMQAKMNEWGWRGCWCHRNAIIFHLFKEADQLGIYAGKGVGGLLWAACQQSAKRLVFARGPTAQLD